MNFFKRLFGKVKNDKELQENVKEAVVDVVDLVKETKEENVVEKKSAKETLLSRLR